MTTPKKLSADELAYITGHAEGPHLVAMKLKDCLRMAVAHIAAQAAEIDAMRAVGLRHAIVPDYDYPGDAEVLAGYSCHECSGSGDTRDGVEHKSGCALKG